MKKQMFLEVYLAIPTLDELKAKGIHGKTNVGIEYRSSKMEPVVGGTFCIMSREKKAEDSWITHRREVELI